MTKEKERNRSWKAIELEAGTDQEDLACWLMIRHGARGCEVKPLDDQRVLLHTVFDLEELPDAELESLKSDLDEFGLASCLNSLRIKIVLEDDWLSEWKKGFEPFPIGDRLLICPPWLKDALTGSQTEGRRLLLVEPAMAFGTGLHPTTRFCLRAAEKYELGPRILDVGTGSGILAIAAALLDNQCEVTAVDVDQDSFQASTENFALNGMSHRIQLMLGSVDAVKGCTYTTLFSNLTCEDIVALLPDYSMLTAGGGIVICAGILAEKLPMLERALAASPFESIEKELEGLWAGLVLRRQRTPAVE